ncbi:MAG: SMC family ATPase, partial [Bacteroidota bacterium]
MIPLRLSIQGLYSYQQKQEIDFRYLTDAHLFGIFGATGSGKSSILEAITFALYGQSSRLNQRENRGYNMMNLRSDRLQIEFGFEAGEKEYLFVVSGRRNSKRFDDVKTFERQAYEIKDGTPSPLPHASAEEILGLSYDNFRRTIIIPQGQFQEFLQLTETERTRMLREIFHLGKFELSNRVSSLERKTNIRIAQTDSLLGQYQQISPEILVEKQTQAAQIVARSEKLNLELKQQHQRLQQLESLQQLFTELAQQQTLLAQLQQQLPEIQERETHIQAYELCLRDFKPLLDRKQELLQEQQRIQTESNQKQNSHQKGQADLEKKINSHQQLEATYEQRDEWNQRARQEVGHVLPLQQQGDVV